MTTVIILCLLALAACVIASEVHYIKEYRKCSYLAALYYNVDKEHFDVWLKEANRLVDRLKAPSKALDMIEEEWYDLNFK